MAFSSVHITLFATSDGIGSSEEIKRILALAYPGSGKVLDKRPVNT